MLGDKTPIHMALLAALALFLATSAIPFPGYGAEVSATTQECLDCHRTVTPGIVADWEKSRHSRTSPSEALKKDPLERRFTAKSAPDQLADVAVGCAECHTLNVDRHADRFDHNGYTIQIVVSPEDCAACHPTERTQFSKNIMSHAHANLYDNPLFHGMADTINGVQEVSDSSVTLQPPKPENEQDSCLSCHGTAIKVLKIESRETSMGDMEFPALEAWPNQGVGRINPDGSSGACTACHTRHQFSIEMARKPETCSQCHKGPDVPAYPVYGVSKHGNIYHSVGHEWDFSAVPWKIGKDFTAPTCAACHISLTVDGEGDVVAERTHQMNDRLSWRIFGLFYASSHPQSPDTTIIRTAGGLPLPTSLDGAESLPFLITPEERDKRRIVMQQNCHRCHDSSWIKGHWDHFEGAIAYSNAMTLASTKLIQEAWKEGVAKGLADNQSIFDEAIEKKWMNQWLFYGNSTRFAAAMMGADYGAFADGRWKMAFNVQALKDYLELKLATKKGLINKETEPKKNAH